MVLEQPAKLSLGNRCVGSSPTLSANLKEVLLDNVLISCYLDGQSLPTLRNRVKISNAARLLKDLI